MKKKMILVALVLTYIIIGCSGDTSSVDADGSGTVQENPDASDTPSVDVDSSGKIQENPDTVSNTLPSLEIVPLMRLGLEDGMEWKLLEISIHKNYQEFETVDYSMKNVFFKFQDDGKLFVFGNTDTSFVFDGFKTGEHFYTYRLLTGSPTSLPSANLLVYNQPLGYPDDPDGRYYAYGVRTNEDIALRIIGDTLMGENYYHWGQTFIKYKK
jgi:hypothetical protein